VNIEMQLKATKGKEFSYSGMRSRVTAAISARLLDDREPIGTERSEAMERLERLALSDLFFKLERFDGETYLLLAIL
jgi:hypothetical protein